MLFWSTGTNENSKLHTVYEVSMFEGLVVLVQQSFVRGELFDALIYVPGQVLVHYVEQYENLLVHVHLNIVTLVSDRLVIKGRSGFFPLI